AGTLKCRPQSDEIDTHVQAIAPTHPAPLPVVVGLPAPTLLAAELAAAATAELPQQVLIYDPHGISPRWASMRSSPTPKYPGCAVATPLVSSPPWYHRTTSTTASNPP